MTHPPLFKGQSEFYKNLLAISIPIMFQNFLGSLVTMLITILVGRLGTVEIAAVGLGNQVFFIYNLTLFGICSGGAIFTAQFWGKKDIAGIRKTLGLCMVLSLGAAILFTLGTSMIPEALISIYSRDPLVIEAGAVYLRHLSPGFIPFALSTVFVLTLRSVEKIRLAVTASVIAISLNATLNIVLIIGVGPFPAMGVRGAAIGVSSARYIEMLTLILGTYIFRYPPAGKPRELFAFNSVYVSRYLKIAIPVMINETLWSLGVTVQNLVFARSSTEAIAALNITGSISGLLWVIFIGFGHGVAILIGKKIGEGNEMEAREYASRIIRFMPIVAVGAACLLIPLSHIMLQVLNVEPSVMRTVRLMIIILCFFYPFKAFHISMVIGTCRAGGDTVFCVVYDLAPMWAIQLPLAILAGFVFQAPPHIIYLCLMVEDPVKLALGLWRFKTGKWLRNVVSD